MRDAHRLGIFHVGWATQCINGLICEVIIKPTLYFWSAFTYETHMWTMTQAFSMWGRAGQ